MQQQPNKGDRTNLPQDYLDKVTRASAETICHQAGIWNKPVSLTNLYQTIDDELWVEKTIAEEKKNNMLSKQILSQTEIPSIKSNQNVLSLVHATQNKDIFIVLL